MGVTIKGRVFNSSICSTLKNGISNVWILLETPKGCAYKCKTNIAGEYSFVDLVECGRYVLYEIVEENNENLEYFPQPKGFYYSTSRRKFTINIKQGEINNNLILDTNYFSHITKKFDSIFKNHNIIIEKNGDAFSIDINSGKIIFERNLALGNDIILYSKNQDKIYTIDDEWNINFLTLNKEKINIGKLESNGIEKINSLFHIGCDNNLYVLTNNKKDFKCFSIDMSKADYCLELKYKKEVINNYSLRLFVYNILDGNIYGITENNKFIKKIDLKTGDIITLTFLGKIDFKTINNIFSDELGYIYFIDIKNNNIFKGILSINSINIIKLSGEINNKNIEFEKIVEKLDSEYSNISEKEFVEEYKYVNVDTMVSGRLVEFEKIKEILIEENVKNGCININRTNGVWGYIPNKKFEGIDYIKLKLILSKNIVYKKIFFDIQENIVTENNNEINFNKKIKKENIEIQEIEMKFSVDKTYTTNGDIIKFKMFIKNTGENTLENLTIKNLNSKGAKFFNDKFLINGTEENFDIVLYEIKIPKLEVQNELHIEYNLKILSIENKFLEFTPQFEYEYNFNALIKKESCFEKIKIQNIMPNIKIEKLIDKDIVIEGDKIKNTIIISNIGKIDIKNLKVKEVIDKSLEYLGELKINGVSSFLSLVDGIKVQNLLIGDSLEINFYTKVVEYKMEVISYSTIEHEYIVNDKKFNSYIESEIIKLKILKNDIKIDKSISKNKLIVGEIFEYYIDIINQGETILEGPIIKWKFSNSIEVIESKIDDDLINFSDNEYLELPSLYPKEKIKITLVAKVNRLLKSIVKDYIFLKGKLINKNFILNKDVEYEDISENFMEIYNPSLKLIKSVSDEYTVVRAELEAKILIINDGDTELQEVIITDILPKELEFIKNSIIIDNLECENESIMSGVIINNMSPGEAVEIKYKFKVIDIQGGQHFVKNKATANYLYNINDINRQGGTVYSNECSINIEKNKLSISKSWNKDFAVLGEEIEFQIIIQNLGTLDAINVLFVDELLDGLELVNRSFSLDGENVNNVNIERGIIIGNICIGEVRKIIYRIKILKVKNLLEYNTKTYIKYGYILENGKIGSLIKCVKNSNEKKLNLAFSNFNIVEKDNILKVYNPKPKIKVIDNIKSDVNIYSSYIIETAKSKSIEGKILTGYKLMIYGVLKQTVEYIALDSDDEIYSIVYEIPFYDAIVLPVGFDISNKVEPYGKIEKNIYKKLSDDKIYSSNTILLLAKILSI